jgi:hypothetical protein
MMSRQRHDVEIEIAEPGVKCRATVYVDGRKVEGLLDYDVEIPKDGKDPVAVTLRFWPRRFKLTARAEVNVEAEDLEAARSIREAIGSLPADPHSLPDRPASEH